LASKKPKDNTNQKWKYDPLTEILESDKEGDLVVNVEHGSKAEGVNAILVPKKAGKSPPQRWYESLKNSTIFSPNYVQVFGAFCKGRQHCCAQCCCEYDSSSILSHLTLSLRRTR
jgi:hypothetical protein